ncbi:hypothetical protein Goklo_022866 [Gossypium klotzschianum]|uniref:RNase H type-1 domain-containing protein n=1 Tax=Gossypium klotzschianum TaxID=34286 RepID=A0A7J8TNV7_9ROSI|nr:hypothetical protein [Gossypium klotzschianum]
MTVNERVPTPFAAEVLALLQVVQVGLDLRLRQIVIEGDALSISVSFRKSPDLVTELHMNLQEKALLALEEDERKLATLEREERPKRHGHEKIKCQGAIEENIHRKSGC